MISVVSDLVAGVVSLATAAALSYQSSKYFYQPLMLVSALALTVASSLSSTMRSVCSLSASSFQLPRTGGQAIFFAGCFILGYQLDILYALALCSSVFVLNVVSRGVVVGSSFLGEARGGHRERERERERER